MEDEARLLKISNFRISLLQLVGLCIVVFAVMLGLAILIVMATPLHTMLPGYLKEEQRVNTVDTQLKVDSLNRVYELNQQYLANLQEVLDTGREVDTLAQREETPEFQEQSFLSQSAREKKFVRAMQQRERYNISVLAPLAAEGLQISDPVTYAVADTTSSDGFTARYITTGGSVVMAVMEGRVADLHYDSSKGSYVVMLQHPKGFASRYSGIGTPLVEKDAFVMAGSALGQGSREVSLQMWRNADPLIPSRILQWHNASFTDESTNNQASAKRLKQ